MMSFHGPPAGEGIFNNPVWFDKRLNSLFTFAEVMSAAISSVWDLFGFVWIYQRFNVDLEIFKLGLYVLERFPYKVIINQNIA